MFIQTPFGRFTLFSFHCVYIVFMTCVSGRGHFFFKGQVEDSATAEISRSQVGVTFLFTEHEILLHLDFNLSLFGSGVAVDQTQGETGGWWEDCGDSWVCQELNARHDGRSEGSSVLSDTKVYLILIPDLYYDGVSFKDLKTKKTKQENRKTTFYYLICL